MINKYFLPLVLFISFIFLSACTPSNEVKLESLDSITKETTNQEQAKVTPQATSTDDQLLKELESDLEPNIDAEFANLEKELGQ